MKKRDLEIIKDLERFRVMSRDDIAELYFSHLKNPITNANTVLKRMARDGQIEVSTDFRPYVYFPSGSNMKRNSTKIPHFLEIVNVYKQIKKYADPKLFMVEPKYKKGLAEPDVFAIFKGTPFFIEIQRNVYSQNVMDSKIKRYEALKDSGIMTTETWQRADKKVFPYVIMITDTRYQIDSDDIRVFQVPSIHDFMKSSTGERKYTPKAQPIKYKLG